MAKGEDVALLRLSEAAPRNVEPLAIALDYVPRSRDRVSYFGFGISSVETGVNGARLGAHGYVTGLDKQSGILQIEGPSACLGDSGGPVLISASGALIGILGQVGNSDDGGLCDLGLSFAYTVVNPQVRQLLSNACDANGGCGPPEVAIGFSEDAAVGDGGRGLTDAGTNPSTHVHHPADGSVAHVDTGQDYERFGESSGCGCEAPGGKLHSSPNCAPVLFAGLAWFRRRAGRWSRQRVSVTYLR